MAPRPGDADLIYQGRCEAIPLADDSVDLVFGSPPYEDARLYGELRFQLKGEDWVRWALSCYVECVRVCRGLVCWVVAGRTRQFRWSATPALLIADLHRAGVKLRHPVIFHKNGAIPGGGASDWLRNDIEFIVCSSKGKLPWSDNTACGHPPRWAPGGEMSYRTSSGARVNMPSHRKPNRYDPPARANPGNVIKVNVGGGHMGSSLAHRHVAPFPQKLADFFVQSFCPPAGFVLDPFSGSGTTGASALANGRRAICGDLASESVELTQKRLANETPALMAL